MARTKKLLVENKFCVVGHTYGSLRGTETERVWMKTVDEAVLRAQQILTDRAKDKTFMYVVQIVRVVKRNPATFNSQVIK